MKQNETIYPEEHTEKDTQGKDLTFCFYIHIIIN